MPARHRRGGTHTGSRWPARRLSHCAVFSLSPFFFFFFFSRVKVTRLEDVDPYVLGPLRLSFSPSLPHPAATWRRIRLTQPARVLVVVRLKLPSFLFSFFNSHRPTGGKRSTGPTSDSYFFFSPCLFFFFRMQPPRGLMSPPARTSPFLSLFSSWTGARLTDCQAKAVAFFFSFATEQQGQFGALLPKSCRYRASPPPFPFPPASGFPSLRQIDGCDTTAKHPSWPR